MFARNPKLETPNTEKIFEAAMDWEASRMESLEKSERRAWTVAKVALGVTALSILAIALMMPLKESTPFLIRVDNATGAVDIVTALKDKQVTGDEVLDRYWLAKYVRARETYDWYTLKTDYDTVGLLSSANAGKEYAQLFDGKDALDKQYGKTVRATVKILSVIPGSAGVLPDSNHVATVRFSKTVKRVDAENSEGETKSWIATVSYEYRTTALADESTRLVNPLGFQVLTYRVDPEMAGGAL
ncbi:MAG TPA: virB8 family protein [Oligoflexus sp.]|uniref:virB8 family protein n=1 Tax=Oligoflexus sp. TaxID=1971216 RepID=UPI002D800E72|nr:virB8 family protein [Oligoflexus sp.]HET9239201.1 virB8 family protein [Oligoflexus sp.]